MRQITTTAMDSKKHRKNRKEKKRELKNETMETQHSISFVFLCDKKHQPQRSRRNTAKFGMKKYR